MKYLITGFGEPFFTNWFSIENTYSPGMVVYDLSGAKYYDGSGEWKEIEYDQL